jgi:hypothetical protein
MNESVANGEDQGKIRKHNAKARAEPIRDAHRKLLGLEAKRAEINEDMREVRSTLKADLGIGLGRFDAIRKLITLEDDERQKAQDDLREAYEALMPGQTLDWVHFSQSESEQPTA